MDKFFFLSSQITKNMKKLAFNEEFKAVSLFWDFQAYLFV